MGTTLSDDELEAVWSEYLSHRDNVRYWGHCCHECVYGPDESEEEDEALREYERTGRMTPKR